MPRNTSLKLALTALTLPAMAVAEHKPTVVIVHKLHDVTNWNEVVFDLTSDGYTVVTATVSGSKSNPDLNKDLQSALDGKRGSKILLVGTEASSDLVNSFAATQRARVTGLVYLSSGGVPPISATVSRIPSYVVHLVPDGRPGVQTEAGFTTYTLAGHHGAASPSELAYAIDRVAHQVPKLAAEVTVAPTPTFVASLQ